MKQTQTKILIVDDQQDNLQVMLNCLFTGGFLNVLCAKNGADALDVAFKELPDLVIIDWDMPELSGIEVLGKLKLNSRTNLIPVIMATGAMLSANNLKTAFKAGATDYIRKPFESVELLARVKSALYAADMLRTISKQKVLITEQNSLLQENEKRLLTLLSASNEALVLVDKDIIIEANELFYCFTGYKKEDVLQHSFYSFFPKEFRKLILDLETMDRDFLSIALLNRDQESMPVEMLVKKFDYNNKIIRAISFYNLSEFRQLFKGEKTDHFLAKELHSRQVNKQFMDLQTENKSLLNELQFKTLKSASRNDFLIELSNCLNEISNLVPPDKNSCKELITQCISRLKQHMNDDAWKEFKLRFSDVHTDFYDKLVFNFPTLRETDLRLCALVKLKMSTKEIAGLINQPVNSVKVARNRLRGKLRIENASESLLSFLVNY